MFPYAAAFALLGSIESLLSAVVADGMTGRRHRSNCELVGQGIGQRRLRPVRRHLRHRDDCAHGDECARGRARPDRGHDALAVPAHLRPGRRAAGELHPARDLAGVLAVVAWNMVEKHAFAALLRSLSGDALVLMTTFLLTIFRDLTEAIIVGFGLGSVIFIHRMSKTTAIETSAPFVAEDKADRANGDRTPYDKSWRTTRTCSSTASRRVLLRRRRIDWLGARPHRRAAAT